jgi:hypothetical protein
MLAALGKAVGKSEMAATLLLVGLVVLSAVALLADRAGRRREQRVYRAIAIEHGMHFSPGDPLRITARVGGQLPIPGAAAVRVIDLMYRTDAAAHHYVFTAEYTLGTLDTRRRLRRVAAWNEPKAAGDRRTDAPVVIAANGVPLVDQYRQLLAGHSNPAAGL